MSRAPFTLRNFLIAGGGVLAAAGLVFGAGYLTADALESDGGGGSPDDAPSQISRLPAVNGASMDIATSSGARDLPASAAPGGQPAADPAASMSEEDAARSMSGYGHGYGGLIYPAPGMPYPCPAPMPEVLNGSTVDVSLAGFDLTLLGEGYTLRSIAVRAEGECGDNGQAESGYLVVDSTWTHLETGFEVYVGQRATPEAVSNVLTPYNAQVWSGGYAYSAGVNPYNVKPMDGAMPTPEDDPRIAELLRAVMSEIAPTVPETCYYQQRAGSWDDLATLGIGDPRPAMPADLSEQWSEFTVFDAPASGCDVVALTGTGGFSASFDDGSNTYVTVSAYAHAGGSAESYGFLDEGSAYWSNDAYSFNVSGYGQAGPLGRDVIEGIALAMDPNFSAACLVTTRPLDPSELSGLGFTAPTAPEGFEIARSNLSATEAPSGNCGDLPDAQYYPQYSLYWSLLSPDGATIEASAYRYGSEAPPAGGYIHEGGLNWTDGAGTQYSVYGYGPDGMSTVDQETIIGVARSMDPTLDPSTLEEGPVAMPMEKPGVGR